jgi:exonuclease SbcD
MRIAHLSDLHLGFRSFPRRERGGNLRERDLAAAFRQALNEVGRLAPDLVLLAGDLFHDPDPPATAFLTLTRGIRRLQEHLPGIPVLAVAGPSETPMAPGDPGPVAVLDAVPGVEAAAGAPRAVHLRELDAHILLVPHRAVIRPPYPELRPDPEARWNLLLLRGHPGAAPGSGALAVETEGWDYVALGGGHDLRHWGGPVRTSGSLERVGGDPWQEAAVEKGFLLADLAAGSVEFHPVAGRPVVDLAPVRVETAETEAGTRRLRELLEGLPGGADGKLLRVRLRGPGTTPTQGISAGLLAAVRRRAAHLELVMESPSGAPGSRPRPADPPGEPLPWLHWSLGDGRSGAVPLLPGLWTLTAAAPADLELLARSLSGEADPRLALRLDGGEGGEAPLLPGPEPPAASAAEPSPAPAPLTLDGAASLSRRADWIEAAGDAEVRALEWARERQEADSRLQAYRERARELRERIRVLREEGPSARCPTCQRPLEAAHPGLLALLEEEWEEVVQDGTWWKRRRGQLEEKPSDLLVLEREALRLQVALEEAGPGGPASSPGAPPPPSGPPLSRSGAASSPSGSARGEAGRKGAGPRGGLPRSPADEVRLVGHLLHRATEGRLDGVVAGEDGHIHLVEADGHARLPTRAEEGLVALAREAARSWRAVEARGGAGVDVRVLTSGRAGVALGPLTRVLEALGHRFLHVSWVALVPPEVAGILPHQRQGTLELGRDDEDRLRFRTLPGGQARVELLFTPR